MKSIVIKVTKVRNCSRGDPSLISGRCGPGSDGVLSLRCCIRLRLVHCVVPWLRPDSQFAFWRPMHLMHKTLRMQALIFADVSCYVIKVSSPLLDHFSNPPAQRATIYTNVYATSGSLVKKYHPNN